MNCKFCEKQFETKTRALYCSDLCRLEEKRNRDREYRRKLALKRDAVKPPLSLSEIPTLGNCLIEETLGMLRAHWEKTFQEMQKFLDPSPSKEGDLTSVDDFLELARVLVEGKLREAQGTPEEEYLKQRVLQLQEATRGLPPLNLGI